MKINPYLNFNGTCEAAFRFYEECLGGKILGIETFESAGMADFVPPDWRNKVMHAALVVGDQVLMGSDAPPGRFDEPKGFSVAIQVDTPEEAERIFHALAENGTVTMPIGETGWAIRFGMLVDQFGTPWMVNCQKQA